MSLDRRMRQLLAVVFALAGSVVARASDITRASVVEEMNVRRAAFGLPPLQEDPRLDGAADDRVGDMEELGYWAHVSPDGRQPFVWILPRGYFYRFAGENLAAGFESAEVLLDAWMESPGHRQNILSPLYRDCGVSVIEGATTGRMEGKSVVVMFATSSAPAQTDPRPEPRP